MARLEVTIVEATNLKQKDKFKKNNSFIRIYLSNQKRKTKIIKNSNDPQWKEVFVFNHLQRQDILYVNIYTEDHFKNEIIGSLAIKLRGLFKKGHIDNWFHIPAKVGLACYGQIHLIMDYRQNGA